MPWMMPFLNNKNQVRQLLSHLHCLFLKRLKKYLFSHQNISFLRLMTRMMSFPQRARQSSECATRGRSVKGFPKYCQMHIYPHSLLSAKCPIAQCTLSLGTKVFKVHIVIHILCSMQCSAGYTA